MGRTLWLDPSFWPRDEAERQLLLCGVDRAMESIPGQVIARIQEFAQAVGPVAFQGLMASFKPGVVEKLNALGSHFSPPPSPVQPNAGSLAAAASSPPPSPLPQPAMAMPAASAGPVAGGFAL